MALNPPKREMRGKPGGKTGREAAGGRGENRLSEPPRGHFPAAALGREVKKFRFLRYAITFNITIYIKGLLEIMQPKRVHSQVTFELS
jgi:hypothetical protein